MPPRPTTGTIATEGRLQKQQRDQRETNLSGVFEGTAGTGGDARFITSSFVGESKDQPAPTALEFFQDKSFSSAPQGFDPFTVNLHLSQDARSGYSADADDDLPYSKYARGATLHQLEAFSQVPKKTDLETPVEKTSRLQREVAEMITFMQFYMERRDDEMKRIEAAAAIPAAAGEVSTDLDYRFRIRAHVLDEGRRFFGADPDTLLKELNGLRDCLEGVVLSDAFQPLMAIGPGKPPLTSVDLSSERAGLTSCAMEFVKSQLEVAEAVAAKEASTKRLEEGGVVVPADSAPFTFELYTVPSAKEAIDVTRILELERRLTELESQLGISKGGQFNLPFADVSSVLKEVVSRLSLLHPSRLDGLTKRFQTLCCQVDELIGRRERLAQLDTPGAKSGAEVQKQKQSISRLYDFCESTRPAAAALPAIVKRLKALRVLHQEGASLTSRLSALELQQADLANLLNTTETHFGELRDAVQTNITWAKEVVKDLEKLQAAEQNQ